MIEKILIICCYFNYHPKTKLVDVKIGFGPSGKIEKVQCTVCKKIFIRENKNKEIDLKIILIAILIFFLLILLL
jgi:hypothetical protein